MARYLFPLSPYNQQRQYEKPVWVYPAHLAMYATYLKNNGNEVIWGIPERLLSPWKDLQERLDKMIEDNFHPINFDEVIKNDFQIDIPFEKLPFPDREFTDAKNKRWQRYGNYKYHPATHMLSALGCTHGKCSFCHERGKELIVRPVDHVIEEIEGLVKQGYKEVFDDSATLPDGLFRASLLHGIRKLNRSIYFSCNLRLSYGDFVGMRKANFRMVLVGIESANQETLDKINKGTKASDIVPVLKKMSEAGLEVHGTFMFGYPWESHEDSIRTVKLAHYLLKKGYAKTAQASVFSPPRTVPSKDAIGHKYVKKVYDVYRSPEFLWRKLRDIKEWSDIAYLIKGGRLIIR